MARTIPLGFGTNPGTTVQVAMSIAARCCREAPATAVNDPPTYSVRPSGETSSERTVGVVEPVIAGAQSVGAPVAPSRTTRFVRDSDEADPDGSPGGRTAVKEPPAKTRPSDSATDHTTPLVCQVDSALLVKSTPDWSAAEAGAATSGTATAGRTPAPNATVARTAAARRATKTPVDLRHPQRPAHRGDAASRVDRFRRLLDAPLGWFSSAVRHC